MDNIKNDEYYLSKIKEDLNVPWVAIKGMRNRIVHDYGYADISFVYDTVINGIPQMYDYLKDI